MDIEVLKRAYEREKERRKQAEKLLEEKSRELFLSYEERDQSHKQLEQTHRSLQKQQEELVQLINAYASVTDDLQLAAKLQTDLLPEPESFKTHAAHGYFQPARFVAGDAYDYFMLSDDVFAFYIIDVEGHGTASAMTSFAIHSQLNPKYDGICRRNLNNCETHEDSVCATVSDLNNTFYNHKSQNKYFTMIYGLLDLKTEQITWCQAGHPALSICSDSKLTELGDGGFPVGTLENPVFEATSCKVAPGDRITVYSDGAIECFSTDGEAFGKARLHKLLSQNSKRTQEECVAEIRDTLFKWNGSDEFADDVTLLLIDYHGSTDQ